MQGKNKSSSCEYGNSFNENKSLTFKAEANGKQLEKLVLKLKKNSLK